MKAKLIFLFSILSLFMFFSACDDNDDSKPTDKGEETDNEYVNNWILDSMSYFYLWNDKLPNESDLSFNSDPYDFFDSLLGYEASLYDGYPFSRMEGTHINIPKTAIADNSATSSDLGFEFIGIYFMNQSGAVAYVANVITYIKKGSLAETQGLKRGYLIGKVDDVKINENNWYSALLQGKSSYKIEYATNQIDLEKGITETKTINVTPGYVENPIFLDSIYTVNNRSIGYVMYNSYEAGGESTLPYDVELSKIFSRFKEKGVKDLIFDLRYNGGGLVRSAKFITSALVPNRNTENLFEVKTYNSEIQGQLDRLPDTNVAKISWMYEYFTDNVQTNKGQVLASIPKLGDQLDNLCFIVTGNTASASELTINALKPYYSNTGKNIYIVGETTVGKNVGSWAIYEENNTRNTYVLWPITFKSHNKLYPAAESSNYANGFSPDSGWKTEDLDMLPYGLQELGNKDETMLKAAMARLTGGTKSYTKYESGRILKRGSSLDRKKENNLMYTDRKDIKSLNIK